MRSMVEVMGDLYTAQQRPTDSQKVTKLQKELKQSTAHFVAQLEMVEMMLLDLPSPVSDELDHNGVDTLQVADMVSEVAAAVEKCDCL